MVFIYPKIIPSQCFFQWFRYQLAHLKLQRLGLAPSLQPPNAATATEPRERRNHRRCRKCECGTWGGWGGIDPSIHPSNVSIRLSISMGPFMYKMCRTSMHMYIYKVCIICIYIYSIHRYINTYIKHICFFSDGTFG
jgi:hypothetical protein